MRDVKKIFKFTHKNETFIFFLFYIKKKNHIGHIFFYFIMYTGYFIKIGPPNNTNGIDMGKWAYFVVKHPVYLLPLSKRRKSFFDVYNLLIKKYINIFFFLSFSWTLCFRSRSRSWTYSLTL